MELPPKPSACAGDHRRIKVGIVGIKVGNGRKYLYKLRENAKKLYI